ncbi:MAG: hypothetical protein ABJB86_12535 [Bacteroidota bacterium]
MMKDSIRTIFFLCVFAGFVFSCTKNNGNSTTTPPPVTPGFTLSYGDSIFFVQNTAADYIITPKQTAAGVYSGFPEGIEIDEKTGAVNVSKSETGLRYRISFKPANGTDTFSTLIVIGGINFIDGFYKLTGKDSILTPVYNANKANAIPGSNGATIFDEGSGCNSAGCNVNTALGSINLAQTVRNGVFGAKPSNNDRHEFQLNYRIDDKSGKALNTLKVKLYYFDSVSDVTQEVYDIISSRDGTLLRQNAAGPLPAAFPSVVNGRTDNINKAAKPRPPCIFILAR